MKSFDFYQFNYYTSNFCHELWYDNYCYLSFASTIIRNLNSEMNKIPYTFYARISYNQKFKFRNG